MRYNLLIVLVGLFALALSVRAQRAEGGSGGSAAGAPAVRNIVLVHGAWADASSWSGVIQRLQKAGYTVTAVQLPMSSLDDDAARTRAVLEAQTGPTILVAHSYGGAVITRLGANAPNVVGLVYESAFAPDQGESLKGLLSGPQQPPGGAAIYPDKTGYLWLKPDGFLQFFAPDVAPTQARVMEAVQKPIAASTFFDASPFDAPAWKSFPTWYIVTTNDQMVPPDAQRLFAKRMGASVTNIAGSHVSMVSHPDVVASVIMKAAESVEIKP